MHCVIASLVPETVTARSVELGSISEATTTEAPVISRISLILEPPLPISDPHCDAGIMSRSVMGGRGMAVPASGPPTSCTVKDKDRRALAIITTLELMSTHTHDAGRAEGESKHPREELIRWRQAASRHVRFHVPYG